MMTILEAMALRRAREAQLKWVGVQAVRHILASNPGGLSARDIVEHAQHFRVLLPRLVVTPSGQVTRALQLTRGEGEWDAATLEKAAHVTRFEGSFTHNLTRPARHPPAVSPPSPSAASLIVPAGPAYKHGSKPRWFFTADAPSQYRRFRTPVTPDTSVVEDQLASVPTMNFLKSSILPILRADSTIRSTRIPNSHPPSFVWRLIIRPKNAPMHIDIKSDEKRKRKLAERQEILKKEALLHLNRRRLRKRLNSSVE